MHSGNTCLCHRMNDTKAIAYTGLSWAPGRSHQSEVLMRLTKYSKLASCQLAGQSSTCLHRHPGQELQPLRRLRDRHMRSSQSSCQLPSLLNMPEVGSAKRDRCFSVDCSYLPCNGDPKGRFRWHLASPEVHLDQLWEQESLRVAPTCNLDPS